MGPGVESGRKPKSEHATEFMETGGNSTPSCRIVVNMKQFQSESQSPEESGMEETDFEVARENSVAVSKCRSSAAASSEIGIEAGNSMVVFKSGSPGSNDKSSSQCHVCRFCSKVFSSGKGLGGHVRIHGAGRSKGRSSRSRNVSRGGHSSKSIGMKKSKVPTSRSNGNSKWIGAGGIEEEGQEAEDDEEYKGTKNMNMDVRQEELSDHKMVSLYTLRRNPKRSKRLTDEEFIMDLTAAKNNRACVGHGKEFPPSKALFGHMRCHPTDDDNQANGNGGAIVVASPDPSSALSTVCLQSSHGSEDLQEKRQEGAASDNTSDRESIKARNADHQPVSCSLLNWSVTSKRGRRVPIRSIQPQKDDAAEEAAAEVDDAKELEDDRDTAHFLVMLASSASNANTVNRPVERHMTEKGEARGSYEHLEAGQEDLGWKKKRVKKMSTGKTSRPVGLGAVVEDKYKCNTCQKHFKSHQALGGHRASQKGCLPITYVNDEVKGVRGQEISEEGSSLLMIEYHPAAVDDVDSSLAREEGKRSNRTYLTKKKRAELAIQVKKDKGHECCICHRVFTSGQALGGHKRSHWTVEKVTDTANNVSSTEKQLKLLKGQVREPLFDLNQPAPAEEEGYEAAYDKVEVVPAFAKRVNHRVKMIETVTINTGFRYVECNICGSLFTSMNGLRTHQTVHT